MEADYAGTGAFPLKFTRYYDNYARADTFDPLYATAAGSRVPIGSFWSHNYSSKVQLNIGSGLITASVTRPDGLEYYFNYVSGVWSGDADVTDQLTSLTDGSGTIIGWQYRLPTSGTTENFDGSGKLTSIVTREGSVQTLNYSDTSTPSNIAPRPGLLIAVQDSFGKVMSFTYDSFGRIAVMTDPAGGTYQYAYDGVTAGCSGRTACNMLTQVAFPLVFGESGPRTRTYVYREAAYTSWTREGVLTGIIDENSNRWGTFQYNSSGKAISTELNGGVEKYTITYGTGNSTILDPLGTSRANLYGVFLGVYKGTSTTQPCPTPGCTGTVSNVATYDANGNASSRTDFNANRTCYAYDLTRNLETKRVEGLSSSAVCSTVLVTPPAPTTANPVRTITTSWHPDWRLEIKRAEPNKLTTWVYNGQPDPSNGNAILNCAPAGALVNGKPIAVLCKQIEQATTDATGSQGFAATSSGTPRVWQTTYNNNGMVLTKDGPRTDVSDVTTTAYYTDTDPDLGKRGNVSSITNALGHVTQITAYNGNGQPLNVTDPNGLVTTLEYDARQRLICKSVGPAVLGNCSTVTPVPAGHERTRYSYDGVGQLTRLTEPDGSTLTYTWDAAHRLTDITDSQNNTIHYTLDNMGNRTQEDVKDPVGTLKRTHGRVYDALNRLWKDIGGTTPVTQITQYGYDAQGNLKTVTDPRNQTTTQSYDALNRLIQVLQPIPATGQAQPFTQYSYSGLDQLLSVTDARNLATQYTRDGLDNLTQQVSPDTGTTINTYDAAGNVLTSKDAKNQTTTTTYDALNRVSLVTYQDTSNVQYGFDQGVNGKGRLSSITDRNSSQQIVSQITYTYESHGRLASETRVIGSATLLTQYGYDSVGRLTSVTYPSGLILTYALDTLGRISGITMTRSGQVSTLLSNVTYEPFGEVAAFTFGNGQSSTRSRDKDGRINGYTLANQSHSVGWDEASRVTSLTSTANTSLTQTYGYDNLDRLTGVVTPQTSYSYSFDAVGNRTTVTTGANTITTTMASTSNRIASMTPPLRTVVSDANGAITADGLHSFTYDARGRQITATGTGGSASFTLNALGQRIKKTVGTTTTLYHYDAAGHLIAETDATGLTKIEYVWLADQPVALLK